MRGYGTLYEFYSLHLLIRQEESHQNDASVSPKVGELDADMIGTLVAIYKMKG
jgi:hypothetical protein